MYRIRKVHTTEKEPEEDKPRRTLFQPNLEYPWEQLPKYKYKTKEVKETAEISQQGFVKYFDHEGVSAGNKQYKSKEDAIHRLFLEGWKIYKSETPKFMKF